jgi:hypothetical protein
VSLGFRLDGKTALVTGAQRRFDETAAPLAFLASPASDGLVGHLLVTDGGQTIF